jgi:hypothetical protein
MNFDEVVPDEDLTETNKTYIRMTRRVKTIAFMGRSCVFNFVWLEKRLFVNGFIFQ